MMVNKIPVWSMIIKLHHNIEEYGTDVALHHKK